VRIYLDHNATTPIRDEVVEAMTRVLRDCYGNPSSVHAEGAAARAALERARERAAVLVGAEPDEIVFTAGATEANNAALHGVLAGAGPGAGLVTTAAEHPSVEEPAAALEALGHPVTRVPVDAEGRMDPGALREALAAPVRLVSLLLANNETGVLQDAVPAAALCRERGVPLHLDATQAVGKLPVSLAALGADLLSASAHKFNGPKGVGFLARRRGLRLEVWQRGGPQERGRRGGTENLAGVVGLGVACELAARELGERAAEGSRLRDRLWQGIREKVARVRRNGSERHVLPGTLSVEFEGADGELLVQALDLEGVAVSAGAACHSGSVTPSRVLLAMGRSPEQARSSLRFSVGHGVTDAQIDRVVALLPDLVARAREVGA
jgi:cysteine desulfurase